MTSDAILAEWGLTKDGPLVLCPGTRDDLAILFRKLGFKTGVEIGVMRGDFSIVLCGANPELHLYGIDPYLDSVEYPGEQFPHEAHYEGAKARLASYNVTLIRQKSPEAAEGFEDESLDFVYIDGNHRFEAVVQDILAWEPKVRSGGIVAGHDYTIFKRKNRQYYSHVKAVIDGWTASYFLDWFLLAGGGKEKTWFWVKK